MPNNKHLWVWGPFSAFLWQLYNSAIVGWKQPHAKTYVYNHFLLGYYLFPILKLFYNLLLSLSWHDLQWCYQYESILSKVQSYFPGNKGECSLYTCSSVVNAHKRRPAFKGNHLSLKSVVELMKSSDKANGRGKSKTTFNNWNFQNFPNVSV